MDCIKNDMYQAKDLSTGSHKIFRYIKAYGEKKFKAYFNILLEMNKKVSHRLTATDIYIIIF